MEYNGIDVSRWQGAINFDKVKKSGIDFVIIKAGGSDCTSGFYTDRNFKANYNNAKMAGLKVGAYFFAGANCNTYEKGVNDAYNFYSIIKGLKFEYPVILDFETANKANKASNTQAVLGFGDFFEKLKYYFMVYGSDISTFKERVNDKDLKRFDHWVARYGSKPTYAKPYGIWQCSSTGKINGISGNVDLDISYNDYANIMRKNHLNGF